MIAIFIKIKVHTKFFFIIVNVKKILKILKSYNFKRKRKEKLINIVYLN